MGRIDLRTALKQAVKTESFSAEFQALAPLVLAFDLDKILDAMAPDLVAGISANLLAGKQPDGQSMPRRADGQPRGVQTGQLARSFAARISPTGLQIHATGTRASDGAVMRAIYGKFRIVPREVTMLKRGRRGPRTTLRTSGTPVINAARLFWGQDFVKRAVKRAVQVIVAQFGRYRGA